MLLRRSTKHRRLRMQRFEVTADRDYLADARTVIELQDGNDAVGINAAEGLAELLAAAQINLYGLQIDTFFRQKNADASWAGCCPAIV